jgi:enoyl-CoA hydratase/carnithine racemase
MPRYESRYDPAMMPQNLEHVLYEKKEHVAYVTINRPEVRNALHTYAYAELRACWLDIARDPDIYVGIVTGAGDAFCAGRDVKFLAEHQAKGIRTPHEDPTNPMYSWGGGGQPKDVQVEKPLISAINGYAVGVGLSIALQCQLRVMADDAWLGDLHTQVGRMGGAHRLYMAVPRAIAAELTLCNARLTAERCYELGIVNAVVPKDQLIPTAEELAERVCNASPLAVQAAVRLYNLCSEFSPEMSALARHLDQETAETEDGAEGPRAFRERRKPQWKLR